MDDDNMDILILTSCILLIKCVLKKRKRRKRKLWSREWLQRRNEGRGVLHMLNTELRTEDPASYRNFLRMTSIQFDHVLDLISSLIERQDTCMRECISSRNKLETTLRFLATGESFTSLMYSTRIHESTISKFVPEVCKALCKTLRDQYLKLPTTTDEWQEAATDFDIMWQFPHCLGALDGRHIHFKAPATAGSFYFNYKGFNSIVLLGLVDAKYIFKDVNIGINGRISDGGVFGQSELVRALNSKSLNCPQASPLPGQTANTPYVIVADDAFPLSEYLMKPFPDRNLANDKRIFNYRLSRARRVVENSFGILANRFRILLNPISLAVDKVELITLTCVLLHNYLATENGNIYSDIPEDYQELPKVGVQGGNRYTSAAKNIREQFKTFFMSPFGSVSWQEEAISRYNH